MNASHLPRRIRLALEAGACQQAAESLAAELARALSAQLEAVFLRDEGLLALAGLPLAREITTTTRRARPLDPGSLQQALEAAVSAAQRRLAHALGPQGAGQQGAAPAFRTVAGGTGAQDRVRALMEGAARGDLMVLPRPAPPALPAGLEALARTGAQALGLGAHPLFVPGTRARRASGGAVLVAASAAPHAMALAEAIALPRRARVVIIEDRGLSLRQIIDAARQHAAIMVLSTAPGQTGARSLAENRVAICREVVSALAVPAASPVLMLAPPDGDGTGG